MHVRTVGMPLDFELRCRAKLRRDRHSTGERTLKIVPRIELQLAEDACQVALHRSSGHEERLRDLSVGHALARELSDPAFACGERLEAGEEHASRPSPGGPKLNLGVLGQACCPDA